MILKAFKEKSNQKYVNKLLSERKVVVNDSKVKSIAVILNADEFSDFESFRVFFKTLDLQSPKQKIIAFAKDDKTEHDIWDIYCSPKDFGWKGNIKNIDLQTFVSEEYDMLISYYKKDVLPLKLITAASKANFKVGLSRTDERLYDLIIDVQPNEIEIFKKEFKKYLNILNKL